MRTRAWLMPLAVLIASACGAPSSPPPTPFLPTASMHDLMLNVIDPAADAVWESVGTVITLEGTFEKFPATDDEWAGVRGAAIQLAESGNLLLLPSRSNGSSEWVAEAQAMIETSRRALKAIEAKDKDALFTIGGDIYDACTSCHSKFIVPDPPSAPAQP